MATDGVEVELKYRVADAAAVARLVAARTMGPFRAAGRVHQVQVEDRYLDTADGALGRAGWAVRLRRGPTMTILSVKSTTPAADALHRREELEGPADPSLDPHAWPPSPARSLVLEHAGDAPLLEIVTVRQLRRTRTLADESAEVELSLDEVAVFAAGRVVDRFIELEAELRRGPAAALDALAAVLADDPDLVPEPASKLERALAAVAAARSGGRPKTRPKGGS
ncbi:MAG: CYTH domain-containing protein, partial [Chloroflexota bacterium]